MEIVRAFDEVKKTSMVFQGFRLNEIVHNIEKNTWNSNFWIPHSRFFMVDFF